MIDTSKLKENPVGDTSKYYRKLTHCVRINIKKPNACFAYKHTPSINNGID